MLSLHWQNAGLSLTILLRPSSLQLSQECRQHEDCSLDFLYWSTFRIYFVKAPPLFLMHAHLFFSEMAGIYWDDILCRRCLWQALVLRATIVLAAVVSEQCKVIQPHSHPSPSLIWGMGSKVPFTCLTHEVMGDSLQLRYVPGKW